MPEENFVDYVKICCRSGKGGAGSVHFHRAKFIAHGGPDGGNGGRGGHIILRGNKQLWTLLHLKYRKHVIASSGQPGSKNMRTGKDGEDVILEVPLGTVAKDADSDEIICEINHDGQSVILVPGGRGGLGNTEFKSATNQAPTYAQPGEPGLEEWKILELKLLADVGLVGFPNAGKSTLLSAVSAAKPKIADYPFTTLVPQLGVVAYKDNQSFVMADIPGIIENAHLGKGLGLRFLRHIERNAVLLFVVSCEEDQILTAYQTLVDEIQLYNPELLDKPRVLGVSKCDLLDQQMLAELQREIHPPIPVVYFSAVSGLGIDNLKNVLWQTLLGSI